MFVFLFGLKTTIFFVWFSFFPFAVCFIFQSVFSFEIKVYFAFNHIFICFVRLVLFGRWLKEAILTLVLHYLSKQR